MDSRLVIASRELRSLGQEKTIVLAIAIQVFIAAFSSFLVVGLVAMYDPSTVAGPGTTLGVAGDASEELLEASDAVDVPARRYPSYRDAVDAFRRGEVDAVLDTERDGPVRVTAVAPDASLRTTRIVVQVRRVLQELERTERVERSGGLANDPLPVPEGTRSSPFFDFTYTILIPLLMFLPVFISGSIMSDSLTEEYERGTLDLLRATPASDRNIVEGKMLAYGSIAVVQAAAWIALLHLNGIAVHRPAAILVLVAALSVAVVVLGGAIALTYRDRRRSQLVYSLSVMLLFGVATAAANPFNAVARLAIGTPSTEVYLALAGYVAASAAALLAARRLLGRRGIG